LTGRNVFLKFHKIIKVFEKLTLIFPKLLLDFLWTICDSSEGKFSLFIRYLYIKKYSKECGDNIYVGKGVVIKNIQNLTLRKNVSIHANCYLDASGGIELGENVSIAHHSSLISFDHTWDHVEVPIKYNPIKKDKIQIDSDVWIGAGVRILKGVTIQNKVVVAAGAVLPSDIYISNSIFGGVPAKKIGSIVKE
jgi:acetyltransferase-like isoleucine patch superfamily enzyme